MPDFLPLIIPIENQVRELDSKLLLAVMAANQGMPAYLGYRTEMDILITKLPRGIYLAKSFTQRSEKMFRILSNLAYTICAWDEEALVPYPAEIYFTRRLSPKALSYVSHLFAWGQQNEDLLRSYPRLPKDVPIHQVGNPRLDLLRTQFEKFYIEEVNRIKQKYGLFILVNTNFGNINAYLPYLNLFVDRDQHGNYLTMGRGATGMPRDFAEGRAQYKQTMFEHFVALIPNLAKNFKNLNIVIRPHPVESQQPYKDLADQYNNVFVAQEKNVIPWIRAAELVLHNSCTTGIEAYLCGSPSIAYVPIDYSTFGDVLPNRLSYCCASQTDVISAIHKKLAGESLAINSGELDQFIEFDQHKYCSSKIIDVLKVVNTESTTNTHYFDRLSGWMLANKRRIVKRIKSRSPQSKYHKSFQEARFPTLSVNELTQKVHTISEILQLDSPPDLKQVYPHIFLVQ